MSQINFNGTQIQSETITIASSGTTSGAIDLGGRGLVGFIMPAAFTGASITFTGSVDDSTYTALYNSDNNQFSITVSTDRYYMLNPADFLGAKYVKFVSDSSEGAERTITVITRTFS